MKTVPVDRKNHLLAYVHLMHFPQKRKYTGEAYTVHLRAVAEMAEQYGLQFGYEIGLCHDLIEDPKVNEQELFDKLLNFGYDIMEADFIVKSVVELTDVYTSESYPNMNRKSRKELECQRMSNISENSQSIKYCDLIDNTKSIVEHDPSFAKIYIQEKQQLLEVMTKGNKYLYKKAKNNMENVKPQVETMPVPGTGSFKKATPDSSSVNQIEYDALKQKFSITFKNGTTYDYAGVTQKDATAAYNAKSAGTIARNELGAYKGVKRV